MKHVTIVVMGNFDSVVETAVKAGLSEVETMPLMGFVMGKIEEEKIPALEATRGVLRVDITPRRA